MSGFVRTECSGDEQGCMAAFLRSGRFRGMAYNTDRTIVGPLCAGSLETCSGYFTHVKDLFHDIMVSTGTQDVRIPAI